MLILDASVRAAGRYRHAAVAGWGIDGKFKNDGMMVGWPAFQHFGRVAAQSLRQTPVKPQRNDIAGIVCRFPRPDVPEAGQACWPDRIEITPALIDGLLAEAEMQVNQLVSHAAHDIRGPRCPSTRRLPAISQRNHRRRRGKQSRPRGS